MARQFVDGFSSEKYDIFDQNGENACDMPDDDGGARKPASRTFTGERAVNTEMRAMGKHNTHRRQPVTRIFFVCPRQCDLLDSLYSVGEFYDSHIHMHTRTTQAVAAG